MTKISEYHDRVASLGCCVCRRMGQLGVTAELHHIAQGSGIRNEYAVAPLCAEHHRGASGLHRMGTKAFLRLYRPPGDTEWGLLVWVLEDMAWNS